MDKVVYAHIDSKGKVFYVGRGILERAYNYNCRTSRWRKRAGERRKFIEHRFKSFFEKYYKPNFSVLILKRDLKELDSIELEEFIISEIKDKYELVNSNFNKNKKII